jgi:hypothetical protein
VLADDFAAEAVGFGVGLVVFDDAVTKADDAGAALDSWGG